MIILWFVLELPHPSWNTLSPFPNLKKVYWKVNIQTLGFIFESAKDYIFRVWKVKWTNTSHIIYKNHFWISWASKGISFGKHLAIINLMPNMTIDQSPANRLNTINWLLLFFLNCFVFINYSVLEQSLAESKAGSKRKRGDIWFIDPLNPYERKREEGCPVGLKNVGNTCWFSAVIQVF